jgi:hypothetical protein
MQVLELKALSSATITAATTKISAMNTAQKQQKVRNTLPIQESEKPIPNAGQPSNEN